jgi:hypothetical protein
MRPAVLVRWLWLMVAGVALLGCDRVRSTRECRRLSLIVEAGRRELDQVTGPKTPAAYRLAEPLYGRIANRLRQTVGSSELRLTTEEYARSVEAMAPSIRAYAEALESNDEERIEAVRVEVDRASRRERIASHRLEDQCHGRF